MRVLYFDCFLGFDLNKLLGALIDLGVNCNLIEHELKALGFDAKLEVLPVVRGMVESKLAILSCQENRVLDYKDVCSLVDTIPTQKIKNNVYSIIETVLAARSEISGKDEGETLFYYDDIVKMVGAVVAQIFLEVEKFVTSPLNAGEDEVCKHILKKAGIELTNENSCICTTDQLGAAFLSNFISEVAPFCNYDIVKVGYGAGERDTDIPNVLRAVIADDGNGDNERIELYELFKEEFAMSLS